MELDTWSVFYNKIMDDFRFNKKNDLKSALLLSDIISRLNNDISLNYIEKLIKGKNVYVFGAGPSLKKHIKNIKVVKNIIDDDKNSNFVIISADGATKALLEENIIPEIIVSDLDGDLTSIFESNNQGSIVVVHAHGDNIENIKKYSPKLKNIVGSTQVPKKIPKLINYGGFTDGDRCCFLAEYFGAEKIILGGMDFGKYTTKYSRPYLKNDVEKADDVKVKKLKYAKLLIDWLKNHGNSKIIYIDELSKL